MDIIAQILSPWIGDGTTASPYRPQLSDDFPGVSWQDVTGTDAAKLIPETNSVVLEIETDEQTINEIASNPAYLVIWQEQKPETESE
jgi:hypothetical protein